MPSPTCTVNGSAPPLNVAGLATITVALASPAGAQYWSILATSTDETTNAALVNSGSVVNMATKTATFQMPAGPGCAVIFTSQVGVTGLGLDANRVPQPSYTTTFKVNVLTNGGLTVFAANEGIEQNATFGWIVDINAFLRTGGGGSTVAVPPFAVTSAAVTLTQANIAAPVTCDTIAIGAAVTITLPPNAAVGSVFTLLDGHAAQSDTGGSWSTHAVTVVPSNNDVIESPATPGTFSALGGTAVLNLNAGGSVTWVRLANGAWKIR